MQHTGEIFFFMQFCFYTLRHEQNCHYFALKNILIQVLMNFDLEDPTGDKQVHVLAQKLACAEQAASHYLNHIYWCIYMYVVMGLNVLNSEWVIH